MRNLSTLLLAGAALLSTPALAQSSDRSWSGIYVGGSLGLDIQDGDNRPVEFDTNLDGSFGDTVRTGAGADAFSPGFCGGAAVGTIPARGCYNDSDRVGYAGHIGIDAELGPVVIGAVGEFGKSHIEDSVTAFSTTPANYVFTRSMDFDAALRARAGVAFGDTLPYVTGGVAYAKLNHEFRSSNTANSFAITDADEDAWGYTVGGGIEQRVADNFSIGILYKYTNLRDDATTVSVGRGTAPATNPFLLVNANGTDMRRTDTRFDWHSARVTASFRF